MGVIVLKLGSGEKLALLLKVGKDNGVSLLYEYAGIGGLSGKLTLSVNELNEGKRVSSSNARVVLTERGRDMNDTRTVGHGNVVVCGNEVCLLVLLPCSLCGAGPERLVLSALKVDTLHLFEYLVCGRILGLKRAENAVKKLLRHIVGVAVRRLYLAIGIRGVYAKRGV